MSDLKRHEIPEAIETTEWTLDVIGAVDAPLVLSRHELESFPHESITDEFACEEGWVADGLRWYGIRVESILDRAAPSDASEYGLVRALDGEYACSFRLDRLAESILAVELDGAPLALEHGGPARLVPEAGDRDCWESVKWVSSIELRETEPTAADTAEDLALSRIA
ncbi:molybdopterin-dependent oxidoreductase [Halopenitus sp. H-Gu1]|uniref:molybdopterin-dependent oxidoreductase n=1 Tax=Halopenitus sp. H-Gu1 TaxID=3242697 RepID=UPI00359D888A